MVGEMVLRIWDVEHGACAMLHHSIDNYHGRLAMIDSGSADSWRPSTYIRNVLGRTRLDYLFITNADQDHMSDLQGLWDENIFVPVWFRNPSYTGADIQAIKQQSGPLSEDAKRYIANCVGFSGFSQQSSTGSASPASAATSSTTSLASSRLSCARYSFSY